LRDFLSLEIFQRKYNRKVYADFKEESCLRQVFYYCKIILELIRFSRYLRKFNDAGILDSGVAKNALAECKKIRSVVRAAKKVSLHSRRTIQKADMIAQSTSMEDHELYVEIRFAL